MTRCLISYAQCMGNDVRDAYSRRATEYTAALGSLSTVHPSDLQLVNSWADQITGPAIDAGCGPGHWTNYLADRGVTTHGVDLVPEFIAHARSTYPGIPFDVGNVNALNATASGSMSGVLAWYSLIHHDPTRMQIPLREFSRVLEPGGSLLLGFFEGPTIERFEHAVAAAYRWPIGKLSDELRAAGFDISETHTRTGRGYRPHGSIVAQRI